MLVGGGDFTDRMGRGAMAVFDPTVGAWSEALATPGGRAFNGLVATPRGLVGVGTDGQVWFGTVNE